ncbi:hypothetical protein LIER_28414 [Lithospermum erythrorhizon]|uniref:DUF4218 domain-containing protein n=1 Tax=Lithospermum erythrorhizon TaxID=34254 RepID=A0AAV3RFL4_LITER
MKGLTPNRGATIPNDFYEAKKMLGPLFLPKPKISACLNNCMLFYKEYENLESCIHCLDLVISQHILENSSVFLVRKENFQLRVALMWTISDFPANEHLPVHLSYEALMGGPIHYRWMYPFEL